MAHNRDYYGILGLSAPHTSASSHTSPAEIRRAYKLALLAAHPDKKTGTSQTPHTVDEVKHAYTILADAKTRSEYDNWILANPGAGYGGPRQEVGMPSSDFVLGLELLDLSDFDVLDPGFEFSDTTAAAPSSSAVQGNGNGQENVRDEAEAQMEWTRACRCGADKGFRILEEELGDAEARGEKEVLVGCEGCSLWVRVGFEVEEG
ncbi:diphthamide biosynthesis protein 4 [Paraphoma chrysanthemicola]|nr:diphthamide biosynthesis protein 4 [Paraphoma chrysanthemicola]